MRLKSVYCIRGDLYKFLSIRRVLAVIAGRMPALDGQREAQ
jgi:hypothetical protein